MTAPSSDIWGNFLCSKYRTTGGSGEVGDWNQQVWVTESQSPEGQIVQSIYENYWHNLKQIATEFFSAGMHSGEVSLKHTKNPLRHLWGKQVKSAIKVTFSH